MPATDSPTPKGPDFDAPNFCHVCALIFQDGAFESFRKNAAVLGDTCHDGYTGTKYWQDHHSTRATLLSAAESGCPICSSWHRSHGNTIWNQVNEETEIGSLFQYRLCVTRYCNYKLRLALRHDTETLVSAIEIAIHFPRKGQDIKPIAQLSADEWKTWDTALRSQSATNTGSDTVLAYAKAALDRCLNSHSNCDLAQGRNWYPTRLLDISSLSMLGKQDPIIRLFETTKMRVTTGYATLSHCWGPDAFWVLTSFNMELFLQGIPLSGFLDTFRQAMITAHKLGLNFIWIDCYCIIQGKDTKAIEDWNEQASQMHKVYTNSTVNIGAAHASNPNDGLFCSRESPSLSTIYWSPTGNMATRKQWYLYLQHTGNRFDRRSMTFSDTQYLLQINSPLLKRGWVVQECVLSPRMLYFSQEQIHWHCSEVACCETFPLGHKGVKGEGMFDTDGFTFWTIKTLPIPTCGPDPIDRNSRAFFSSSNRWNLDTKEARLYARWFKMLSKYTDSVLSHRNKDLLKAVEGIGVHVATLTSDSYYRGFLSGTMPNGLLWGLDSHDIDEEVPTYHDSMPSWHWGVYDYKIRMYHWRNYTNYRPLAHVFMSKEVKDFPSSQENSLWPYICVFGCLVPISNAIRYLAPLRWTGKAIGLGYDRCVFIDPAQGIKKEYAFLPFFEHGDIHCPIETVGLLLGRKDKDHVWRRAGVVEYHCSFHHHKGNHKRCWPRRSKAGKAQLIVIR